MFKNYFKTALRNLLKNKTFSAINIFGLATGMAACIIMMLSKDFLIYVLIAAIIAWPLAWLSVYKWLQDYAYRIEISWWIFLTAVFIAMIVAFVTIRFQAIKAAVANPVKSLRKG
jgi:CDP-diglyceride synthetase